LISVIFINQLMHSVIRVIDVKILIYNIFVNCNWVVTRWQQYTFTHKKYIELYKTNNTQNNTTIGRVQTVPRLG